MDLQISDTIHGNIEMDETAGRLLDTVEMQRLARIKQLGLAYLVFPGSNHSRFEHSIGTYHLCRSMARKLNLDEEDGRLVSYAGLLHDIGHIPFSHTFETVLEEKLGMDHMNRTQDLIKGTIALEREASIPGILEEGGVDIDKLADLIRGPKTDPDQSKLITSSEDGQAFFNEKRVLHQIIHSTVDADQLDFLMRDSHYTGVAHGVIDLQRLLSSLTIKSNDLAITHKGVTAVEGMLVARGLMYTAVYFHKTIRIAALMMVRALERILEREDRTTDIANMVDGNFVCWMEERDESGLMDAINKRKLYKMAWGLRVDEITDDNRNSLTNFLTKNQIRSIEKELALRSGGEEGDVIVDIPEESLLISEPRIRKTELNVVEKSGKVRTFDKCSPIASALRRRTVSQWALIVSCKKEIREKVNQKAKQRFSEIM